MVEDLAALATLVAFSALVETERKRSPLNWWLYASCAEAVARAAAKIRAEVLMVLSGRCKRMMIVLIMLDYEKSGLPICFCLVVVQLFDPLCTEASMRKTRLIGSICRRSISGQNDKNTAPK